jgi:hypothetical protein
MAVEDETLALTRAARLVKQVQFLSVVYRHPVTVANANVPESAYRTLHLGVLRFRPARCAERYPPCR